MPETPHYDELCEIYRDGIPCAPDFNWTRDVLDVHAVNFPDTLAIHWVAADFSQEIKISYSQLSDASHRMAISLERDHGIKKGDRVMIVMGKQSDWWIAIFGLMRIGAIPVPGTSLLVAKDLKFRSESSKCVAFIGDDSTCGRFEDVAASLGISKIFQIRLNGDSLGNGRVDFNASYRNIRQGSRFVSKVPTSSTDLAFLYFTSGTTSLPKQVLIEQEMLLGHTITSHWYQLTQGDYFANSVDLGWAKAAYFTFGGMNVGATLFVQPPPAGAFDPTHLLESLHRYPIAVLCSPPTIYRSLVTTESFDYLSRYPLKSLRHCVGAGEPLNAAVIQSWKQRTGITISDGYGQTETVLIVGNHKGMEIRPGSMGRPSPGVEMAILGPNGVLGAGLEGEIAVRTDVGGGRNWIFKGYVKDGVVDKRITTFSGSSQTWYRTGDRGFLDVDGYYWFVGRDDDVISSAGYRIGPFEVESTLKEHPAILESAAVGSPDRARNEIVKAFIVLSTEYATDDPKKLLDLALELQNFCKKNAAPYKYPREIEFVKDLSAFKTVSGKIRRGELKKNEYEKKKDIVAALKSKL